MDEVEYRPVSACLRPPRFAVAYKTGDHWIYHVRQVLAAVCRMWGGAGAIILPIGDDGIVPATLLPLLRIYDPDLVVGHVRLVADLPAVNPDATTRFVQQFAVPGERPDQTLARLATEPIDEASWDEFAEQADVWCSPFKGVGQDERAYSGNEVHWFDRHSTAERDLTVLPDAVDGERILTLSLDNVDPMIALMIETRIGSVTSTGKHLAETLPLAVSTQDIPDFVRLSVTGQPQMYTWDAHAAWLKAKGLLAMPQPPALLTAAQFLAATPMARAKRWTARVQTGEAPIVCVIGDTAADHALAVLCDRLFFHGAWMPRSLLDRDTPEGKAATVAMHSLRHIPGAPHRPVLVTSASESVDEVTSIVDDLNGLFGMHNLDGSPISTGRGFEVVTVADLVAETGRFFLADPVAFAVRRTVPVRDRAGELSILTPLQLPLPAIADQVGDARWCVDVSIGRYAAPPRTALSSRIFLQDPDGGFPEAVTRAGRHGVSFGSANIGFVLAGTPLEGRIAHPLLRFPSAEQIFAELAAARGATVQRSDAGRRAANAVELWGTLDALLADLKGPVRGLLATFLPPPGKRSGAYPGGYAIRGDGFLTFAHATEALAPAGLNARVVLDRLVLANVLRRGLVLTCGRCRWQTFHRVEELGPSSFTCPACGHLSPLIRDAWASSEAEPVWHYSLDQVVRELLRQHGDVPLLAVDHLRQQRRALLWSPELAVTKRNGTVELDIAVVIDGRIIVGEAKSNGRLGSGDKTPTNAGIRLVAAAQTLSADEIVIATGTPSWATGTRAAIDAAIESKWSRGPKPTITEITGLTSSRTVRASM